MDLIAAVVWHWWIALLLVIATVPLVIATIVGYFTKVVAPRYNSRHQRETRAQSAGEPE
ncbi:MAG: hypothetical protein OXH29_00730 [bacterium]|nr:hypothetical protein [bacterium]